MGIACEIVGLQPGVNIKYHLRRSDRTLEYWISSVIRELHGVDAIYLDPQLLVDESSTLVPDITWNNLENSEETGLWQFTIGECVKTYVGLDGEHTSIIHAETIMTKSELWSIGLETEKAGFSLRWKLRKWLASKNAPHTPRGRHGIQSSRGRKTRN